MQTALSRFRFLYPCSPHLLLFASDEPRVAELSPGKMRLILARQIRSLGQPLKAAQFGGIHILRLASLIYKALDSEPNVLYVVLKRSHDVTQVHQANGGHVANSVEVEAESPQSTLVLRPQLFDLRERGSPPTGS